MTATTALAAALTERGFRAFAAGTRVRVAVPPDPQMLEVTSAFLPGRGTVFAWSLNGRHSTHPRGDPQGTAEKIAAQLADEPRTLDQLRQKYRLWLCMTRPDGRHVASVPGVRFIDDTIAGLGRQLADFHATPRPGVTPCTATPRSQETNPRYTKEPPASITGGNNTHPQEGPNPMTDDMWKTWGSQSYPAFVGNEGQAKRYLVEHLTGVPTAYVEDPDGATWSYHNEQWVKD